MRKLIFFVALVFLVTISFSGNAKNNEGDTLVLIKTNYGNITVKLYDKTVKHKENFLKLVNEGFYNGLLFHRVIRNFMIQGGDPDSKNADKDKKLGGGSLGYTLPAEIFPEYYHKRGAFAMARRGGLWNPEKRSSASQFYIIQGEVYTPGQLDTLVMRRNENRKRQIFSLELARREKEANELKAKKDYDALKQLLVDVRLKTDTLFEKEGPFKFSDEQRKVYTTIGGYPSLDGEYTVFGEVVDGMDVVDKIAEVKTDQYNRPLENIEMQMKLDK